MFARRWTWRVDRMNSEGEWKSFMCSYEKINQITCTVKWKRTLWLRCRLLDEDLLPLMKFFEKMNYNNSKIIFLWIFKIFLLTQIFTYAICHSLQTIITSQEKLYRKKARMMRDENFTENPFLRFLLFLQHLRQYNT
jgi:hypothetical protein